MPHSNYHAYLYMRPAPTWPYVFVSRRIASSIAIAIFRGGAYSVFRVVLSNSAPSPSFQSHCRLRLREHPLPQYGERDGRS